MSDLSERFSDGLHREMELLRQETARWDARSRRGDWNVRHDPPSLDVSALSLPQVRALMDERYEKASLARKLPEAEKRIAELEQRV